MGKAFFNGWQLWEKMVFVLACSIVATILAGCVKLWVDHRRRLRFAKNPPVQTELCREKSIIRSLSKRSTKTSVTEKRPRVIEDGVEVPFGIRAIESGIEVDGVWISRSNSPLQLPSRNSSGNFIYNGLPNNSSSDFSARTDPLMSSLPGSRPASLSMNRSTSQDSLGSFPSPSSVNMMNNQPGAIRYPPHSYMRYENTRHLRKSSAMTSSDSLSRPGSSYDSGRSYRSTSMDTTYRNNSTSSIEATSPYQDIPMAQPRAVNHAALDMLQAHRLSHAAETGQLVPRIRKAGHSGEWASIANFMPIVSGEIVNFTPPRESMCITTPPASASSNASDPFSSPSTEKRSADFSEPQSATTESSSRSYEMLPRVRRASSSVSGSSFSASRPESCVLREVNSGFSVLRPGTLQAEAQARAQRNQSKSPPQRRRSRSMSIYTTSTITNSTYTNSTEKRQSQALDIQRRPSEASVASAASDRTSMSLDSEEQGPSTVFSGSEVSRPPSALEIARGAEFERHSIVKFSFDAGQRPPSAAEVVRGAEMDAGAKYKF